MLIIKTAFLETSAINKCCDKNISGYQFKTILAQQKIIPVVGIYTLYELVRTHIFDLEKAKKLFHFIKELEPYFSSRKDILYKKEVEKLKDGKSISYLVDSIDLNEEINSRILAYSNGLFSDTDREFIELRQAYLTSDMRNWAPSTFDGKRINPNLTPFSEFAKEFFNSERCLNEIKNLVFMITKVELLDYELYKLKQNLDSYPALKTLINSLLYLNYVVKSAGNTPAEDKFTDQLQLIEAAYCSIFISGDGKHLKYVYKINPYIECHSIQNYLNADT